MTARFRVAELVEFASSIFERAGHPRADAALIAETLVEADLLGHSTHGLQLVPGYISASLDGTMTIGGAAVAIRDVGASVVLDGEWRSGILLIRRALDLAAERARTFGLCAIAIRRSHHTACLEAYLERITDQGLIATLMCSDPAGSTVAPFGGLDPVLQPDPIAFGIPTRSNPILIDMSTSITSNALVNRLASTGERLPGRWVQDSEGRETDDPTVVSATPPGSLLPTGGQDHGYKGYALALAVESLTQGLAGYGRKAPEARWGASVLIHVYDAELFSGLDEFRAQSQRITELARTSRPRPGVAEVRIPGTSAVDHKHEALRNGLDLAEPIVSGLSKVAQELRVDFPEML